MNKSTAVSGGPRRRPRWVLPLMAIAVVVLLAALWSGLVHLGLPIPEGGSSLHQGHGPMIVLGFLGTLIAVERAVALGKGWAYTSPTAAAAGGVAVVVEAPDWVAPVLAILAGVLLVAIFVAVHRIQPALHNTVLAAGACCWAVAAVLWLMAWEVARFVPWLAAFLVLTIAGERLELSRMTGATRISRWLFLITSGIFGIGLALSLGVETVGIRVAGAGLLGLSLWLTYYDIARRTVRQRGVTRFMAVALLTGYVWLGVGGGLWAVIGRMPGTGWAYDAMLHTVFIGFVLSMVFAHAPVIFPAVLGNPLPYRPILLLPLVMLHLTLLLRLIGGDAARNTTVQQWGGILNEVALLLYLGLAISMMLGAKSFRRTAPEPAAQPLMPTFGTLSGPETKPRPPEQRDPEISNPVDHDNQRFV